MIHANKELKIKRDCLKLSLCSFQHSLNAGLTESMSLSLRMLCPHIIKVMLRRLFVLEVEKELPKLIGKCKAR